MNPNTSENSRGRAAVLRRLLAFGLIAVAAHNHLAAQDAAGAKQDAKADKTSAQSKDQSSKTTTLEGSGSEKKDDVVTMEKFTTTGTRIRSLVGEQSAMPVLSIPQVELEQRGVTRLADVRWAIPQLAASTGFNDNLNSGGPSRAQMTSTSFNLRGLGGNSTLVLVNGHRVPHTGQEAPGGAGGREDFSVDGIPVSAIERIEVLPQGAGAIYGSEAMAGVVNIILKSRYTGAEVQYSYDNSFNTDVANQNVTLTGGYTVGKFSSFVTANYGTQNPMTGYDRWFSATYDKTPWGGTNALTTAPYVAGSLATGYYPDPAAGYTKTNLPGLSTGIVGLPSGTNGTSYTPAQLAAAPLGAHYDAAPDTYLIDRSITRGFVAKNTYNYANWAEFYLTGRWSDFRDTYYGTYQTLTQQLPVGYVGNPFSVPVYLTKVFYDLPVPETHSQQINSGLDFGVRGNLPFDWRYDVGANLARNVVRDTMVYGTFDYTKLGAAMAGSNPVVLTYDSVMGVDPNPAGLMNSLLSSSYHKDTTTVSQYQAQADGPVWHGWAGPIRLAVGGETQQEKVKFFRTPAVSYMLSAPFSRTTDAGFSEVSVPLLSDAQKIPMVHRVEVSAAKRWENLSDIGSHDTSTLNGIYQPAKWLSLRASRSEGFKAPKLYDLLAPEYTSTSTFTASRNVRDTLRGGEVVTGTINLVSGGQPKLKPESSVSRNAGVVLEVPYVKGLSLSVDFWDMNFTNQVGSPSYQNLIDFFPERITRGPASDGFAYGKITGMDTSNINMAKVKLSGVDYRLSYFFHTSLGDFTASAALSDTRDRVSQSSPSASPFHEENPCRGSGSIFWNRDGWEAGVSVNYQARYKRYTSYTSYIEWNPQVACDLGKAIHWNNATLARVFNGTKIRLTVINVFNNEPSDWAMANNIVTMDQRLSRYIINVTKKF